MIDHRTVRLGKLPALPADKSKRVMLRDVMTLNLPAPPVACDWTRGVTTRPAFGNDRVGDCTCAAIANTMVGLLKVVYDSSWVPTTPNVLDLYSAITGYDPSQTDSNGSNPTDRGAVIEDVVAYVIKHGFDGHHFLASGAVQPSDVDNIKRSIEWFGNVDLGVELPLAWQDASCWTLLPNQSGNNKPGTWGGHCVTAEKYDEQYLYVWTWGEMIPVEWKAVAAYFDTADPLIGAAWIKDGRSPEGVDLGALERRIAALRQAM